MAHRPVLWVTLCLAAPMQKFDDSGLPASVCPVLVQMGRQDTLLPSSGGLRSEAVQSRLLNYIHALVTIRFHEAGAVKSQSSVC